MIKMKKLLITEKRELPTDGITKIHTLTQRNNHTDMFNSLNI